MARCDLARVYNCPFTLANERLSSLLNVSWPLDFNKENKTLSRKACYALGFKAEDWNEQLFIHGHQSLA